MSYKLNTVIYSESIPTLPDYFHVIHADRDDNSHFFYTDTLYIIDVVSPSYLIDKIRIFARNPVIALVWEETDFYLCDIYIDNISDIVNVAPKYLKHRIPKSMLTVIKEIQESDENSLPLSNFTENEISSLELLNLGYAHKDKLYINLTSLSEQFFNENRKEHIESIMIENRQAFRLDGKFVVPFLGKRADNPHHSESYTEFDNVPYFIFVKLMCKLSSSINPDYKRNYFSSLNFGIYHKINSLYVYFDDDQTNATIFNEILNLCFLENVKGVKFSCKGLNSKFYSELIQQIMNRYENEILPDDFDEIDRNIGDNVWVIAKVLMEGDNEEKYYKFFVNKITQFLISGECNVTRTIISESFKPIDKNEDYISINKLYLNILFPNGTILTLDNIGGRKVLNFEWIGLKSSNDYVEGLERYEDIHGTIRFYYPGAEIAHTIKSGKFLAVNVIGTTTEVGKSSLISKLLGVNNTSQTFSRKVELSVLKEDNLQISFCDSVSRLKLSKINELFYRDGDLFLVIYNSTHDYDGTKMQLLVELLRNQYPSSEIIVVSTKAERKEYTQNFISGIVKNFFFFDSENGYNTDELKSFLIQQASERSFPPSFIELQKKIEEMDVLYITKEEFSNIVNNSEIEENFAKYLLETKELSDEGDVYIKNSKLSEYLSYFTKVEYSKDDLKSIFLDNKEIRILRNFMIKHELAFYRDKVLYIAFNMEQIYKTNTSEIGEKMNKFVSEQKSYKLSLYSANFYSIGIELICRLSKYLNLTLSLINLLFFKIQDCDFVIYIEQGFVGTDLNVFFLEENYKMISYVLQIVKSVVFKHKCFHKIKLDNNKIYAGDIQTGNQLIDCATTFFYNGLGNKKMFLFDNNKKYEVNLDFVNTLSDYKEIFESGKVLYLLTIRNTKIPVSKKEDFFEKWEVLNDLEEPCTEEEMKNSKVISRKTGPIIKALINDTSDVYNYLSYMFGDYHEEFTEYKNDFGKIDLIRYNEEKQLLRVNFVDGVGGGKTSLIDRIITGSHELSYRRHGLNFYNLINNEMEILISDSNFAEMYRSINDLFYKDGDLFVVFSNADIDTTPHTLPVKLERIKVKFPSSPIAICVPFLDYHTNMGYVLPEKSFLSIAKNLGINDVFRLDSTTGNGVDKFKDFLYQHKPTIVESIPSVFKALYKKLKQLDFLYMPKENFYSLLEGIEDKDKFVQYLINRNFIREEGNNYINNKNLISNLELFIYEKDIKILSDGDLKNLWKNLSNDEVDVMKKLILKHELGFSINENLYSVRSIPYKHIEINRRYIIKSVSDALNIDIQYKNYFEFEVNYGFYAEIKRKLLARSAKYLSIDFEMTSGDLIVLELGNDKVAILFGSYSRIYVVPLEKDSQISVLLRLMKNIFDETVYSKIYPNLVIDYHIISSSDLFRVIQNPEKMKSYRNENLIESTIWFFLDHASEDNLILKYNNKQKEVKINSKNIKYTI